MVNFPITDTTKKEVSPGIHVETTMTLHEDGTLICRTHSRTDNQLQGAHVVVMIFLYDVSDNILWYSQQHVCGVAGIWDPTGPSDRTCPWSEQVPAFVMDKVNGYLIIQENKGGSDTLDWFKAIATSRASKGDIKMSVSKYQINHSQIATLVDTAQSGSTITSTQNNYSNENSLVNIISEIEKLFDYVKTRYSDVDATENEKQTIVSMEISRKAKIDPTFLDRLLSAAKSGGIELVKVLTNNGFVSVSLETFRGWLEVKKRRKSL